MLSTRRSYLFVTALMASVAMQGFASPAERKLLSLVPADAQIVAGIEDPQNSESHGRLLLVTQNNNLDFTDWVALTGVDAHRTADDVIAVAASSLQGELSEHLLLVEGSFDKELICKAAGKTAQQNRK